MYFISTINFLFNHGFVFLGEDIEEYYEVDQVDDSNERDAVHYNQIEEETRRDDICRALYDKI